MIHDMVNLAGFSRLSFVVKEALGRTDDEVFGNCGLFFHFPLL